MTREEIAQEVLQIKSNNILLELATGTGKSRIALELAKYKYKESILIVVNRLVHINTWQSEIKKWWNKKYKCIFKFTTYASLHKHSGNYTCVIFDECHHLSERCRDIIKSSYNIDNSILLSATVSKDLKKELSHLFKGLVVYNKSLRDVIENEILPDPKVYLIPLHLDNTILSEKIIKNPKATGGRMKVKYQDRWSYIRNPKFKNTILEIACTKKQYLLELNQQIDYWKRRYDNTRSSIFRNKWLHLCSDRLRWLSDKKEHIIYRLLAATTNYRTLTFCNSIEQTEKYGKYCINSKNEMSKVYLEQFNKGKIRHITACNILNEGVNLGECQVGIFANLNSSEIIVKQRNGRLLRHPNPIIIIPYYKDSRDEELVAKMMENYNPELVITISENDINKLKL